MEFLFCLLLIYSAISVVSYLYMQLQALQDDSERRKKLNLLNYEAVWYFSWLSMQLNFSLLRGFNFYEINGWVLYFIFHQECMYEFTSSNGISLHCKSKVDDEVVDSWPPWVCGLINKRTCIDELYHVHLKHNLHILCSCNSLLPSPHSPLFLSYMGKTKNHNSWSNKEGLTRPILVSFTFFFTLLHHFHYQNYSDIVEDVDFFAPSLVAQKGDDAFICWYWNCMQWVLFDSFISPGNISQGRIKS